MRSAGFGAAALRLQLALRANPLLAAAGLALLACVAALAWTVQAGARIDAEAAALQAAATRAASMPAPVPAPPALAPAGALDAFYSALGRRPEIERQLGTLFALASRNGLTLSQGEYKTGYDRNARVHTYQIDLPVKGSYAAIWRFALGALRAIPFAALDEISFRRDAIGDPAGEAHLRLTLYLKDLPGEEP